MAGTLLAFIISMIMAILFSPYKRNKSLFPFAILCFVLFSAGLSAQFWVIPFGPLLFGVSWLRILFVVFIFALLFSSPALNRIPLVESREEAPEPGILALSLFIWIVLFLLVISIVVGLYYSESANPI